MNDRFRTPEDGQTSGENVRDIEIDLVELLRLFARRSRLTLTVVLAVALITAGVMLLTPNKYTSRATILPSGGGSEMSGLIGLAGSLGFQSGNMGIDENSSALYPSILQSDLVRDGVLSRTYSLETNDGPRAVSMEEYFDTDDPDRLRAALARVTSIDTDKKLGVVKISVETAYPGLSRAMLEEYLSQLEHYLIFKRRTQAGNNESYLDRQLADRKKSLQAAEEDLRQFMQSNRNWSVSTDPNLRIEMARLEREVEIQSETHLLLTKQLELARLEANKDIPIVRILDAPSLPTIKSGPSRTLTVIVAAILGLAAMAVYILAAYIWAQMSADGGRERLENLRRDLSQAMPRPSRVLNIISRSNKRREQVAVDD